MQTAPTIDLRRAGGAFTKSDSPVFDATSKQSLQSATAAARDFSGLAVERIVIVRAPDRDQLRGQITGTKTVRTLSYPSRKTQRARFAEGAAEFERIEAEEVEVAVVDGVAQPMRIEALVHTPAGPNWLSHIPDFATLYANGERALVDAKRVWSDFRKPLGYKQTFLGQLAADMMGYRYERIILGSAGSDVRRRNINEVQAARFVHVPDHLAARAALILKAGGISLGHLSDLLHPANGRAMVFALMVRRLVEIDLDRPLGVNSECRAVPALPSAMPSIRH
ncbi:hypothetical protein [uncultured Sphingomonas sp.]|uniref:hypothetical protein n=1 Tax=uncultured Sphingomonas sp. TaxID=158754 RepID=UPI0025E280C3|nr:hypothetical protein [uncultured Sphingomonas sp.]